MAAYRELGRISDPTILKFFVLYVLQALGGSTAKGAMEEVAMMTESASYFDYAQALDALLSTGHIAVEEGGDYVITPLGEDAHGHFYNQVPTWVRGRVGRAVMEYRAKLKYDSEIGYEVERLPDQAALVTLWIRNEGRPVFSTTLRMPSPDQADLLGREFKKNPASLYRPVVAALSELMDGIYHGGL